MNKLFGFFLLALAFLTPSRADAAARFWVGGPGTWDASDTTHWAATSGGAGGQSVPTTGDTVTLDGSSGGGTVTVNTTVTVASITMSAFTGTLDFATNDNNVNLVSFVNGGSATRTLNMGDGTWTITQTTGIAWNQGGATNLTFNANGSTLVFAGTSATARTASFGTGYTYNIVTFNANSSGGGWAIAGANTYTTLNIAAPNSFAFTASTTYTITNALTFTGSSGSAIFLSSATFGTSFTLALGAASTCSWCAIRDMTNTTNSFTFTNSFDLGKNTFTGGGSISPPSGGSGGGRIIGG
jgi:hypothetical protein